MIRRGGLMDIVMLRGMRPESLNVAVADSPHECHTAQDGKPGAGTTRSSASRLRGHQCVNFLKNPTIFRLHLAT
jgi:hypothetical protein